MSGQTGMMRAVVARRPGGPDVLEIDMRPRPVPAEGQILVRVEAAGVNRPDILQRMGNYPVPPGASDALGLEVAGEVVTRGAHAARYAEGARVTALVPGGGYADYCVVDERNALPIPAGLTAIEAAAIPETYFTVWTNVFDRAPSKREKLCWSMAEPPASARRRSRSPRPSARALSRRRGRTTRRGSASGSGPTRASTIGPRTSSSGPWRRPEDAAPMSSSTWSAGTMSRATTQPRRWTGGSCRSPTCRGRPRRSTCGHSCRSALSIPARRSAPVRRRRRGQSRTPSKKRCGHSSRPGAASRLSIPCFRSPMLQMRTGAWRARPMSARSF